MTGDIIQPTPVTKTPPASRIIWLDVTLPPINLWSFPKQYRDFYPREKRSIWLDLDLNE